MNSSVDWREVALFGGLWLVLSVLLTVPAAFLIGLLLYPDMHPDLWPASLNYQAPLLSTLVAGLIVWLVWHGARKRWK